jgi:hypothetical protein
MNYNLNQLSVLSDDELITLRISIHKEMRLRGIKFSVGELGEKTAIDFFNNTSGLSNLMAAPTGAKNVDALSRDGDSDLPPIIRTTILRHRNNYYIRLWHGENSHPTSSSR